MRHLDTTYFWVHEKSANRSIDCRQICGSKNGADLFADGLPWHAIEKHMASMEVEALQSNTFHGLQLAVA